MPQVTHEEYKPIQPYVPCVASIPEEEHKYDVHFVNPTIEKPETTYERYS